MRVDDGTEGFVTPKLLGREGGRRGCFSCEGGKMEGKAFDPAVESGASVVNKQHQGHTIRTFSFYSLNTATLIKDKTDSQSIL